MKTILDAATRFNGSISPVLPAPARTGARPVRRGNLWPGESFVSNQSRWKLTDSLDKQAFILPALVAYHGPQIR